MQSSGVSVSDTCKITFEEIKKDKKHRYVIFFIRDEKQIDVEVVGARDAEYDSFLEDIQKGGSGECRYVVVAGTTVDEEGGDGGGGGGSSYENRRPIPIN